MIAALPNAAEAAIWAAVLAACIALDGLYCGLETGLYVLNKIRLDLRAEAGSPAARFLRRRLARPNELLADLLIGTNLSRYVATFSITSLLVLAGAGTGTEWIALAVATPLLFVTGDAVPKSVFQRAAETLVYRCAWLLRASHWAFAATGLAPLVRAIASLPLRLMPRREGSPLERQPVAAIVAEGHASGVLTHVQSVMADRVMRLRFVRLWDVMRPMRQAACVAAGAGREPLLAAIAAHDYSRLPIRDEGGQVVGILDVLDVLTDPAAPDPVARAVPPVVLSSELGVTDALFRMQRAKAPMAVVADDRGRHVGIVTFKDLVEEIVGELEAW